MRTMKRWGLPLILLLLLVGCAPAMAQRVTLAQNRAAAPARPIAESAPAGEAARESDAPAPAHATQEESAAPATQADLSAAAQGSNAFGLELLAMLRGDNPNGNVVYSPLSIYSAFAMLYAGAEGKTAAQLADVLHMQGDPGALLRALTAHPREGFTLNIANALWGQAGLEFNQGFTDALARDFGAALRTAEFAGGGAADAINRWVSDATQGRIPALVESVDPATVLLLANAIYLDAEWATPFEEGATRPAPFTALDGSAAEAEMMHVTDGFAYAEGEGYQIVALPYAGGSARMIVMLPAEGNFAAFEESLTAEQFAALVAQVDSAERQVALTLPRFDYETTTNLVDALGKMGLTLPFSDEAEFGGIAAGQPMTVGGAVHKANITVDEAGTEAAAATALAVETMAMPVESDPVTMTVDRPFLYFIQDTQSDAILFMGRIVAME